MGLRGTHRITVVLALTAASVLLPVACTTTVSRRELAEEYYNLGNAFYDIGRFDESYRYYSRAIELDDEFPAASVNLARLYIDRGEYERAAEVLAQIEKIDPSNLIVRESIAYLDFVRGHTTESFRRYAAIASEFPGRTTAAYNLAVVGRSLGREREVLPYLQTAVVIEPLDSGLQWELAYALWSTGRNEEMLAALATYHDLIQQDPESLVLLGERFFDWEYPLRAIEVFEEAKAGAELPYESKLHLAFSYLVASDDFSVGLELLEETLFQEEPPDEIDLETELARILDRLPEDDSSAVSDLIEEWKTVKSSEYAKGL